MLHWPPTTFEISNFFFSPSYHHLQRPRCHLHVANRINFFVIFWNGKWEERIFCTTHGVPAVCTHCHMTGMPWFLSCGAIYVTPCQEWLLGQKAHKSAASRTITTTEVEVIRSCYCCSVKETMLMWLSMEIFKYGAVMPPKLRISQKCRRMTT